MEKKTVGSICKCGTAMTLNVLPGLASNVTTCPHCGAGYEVVVRPCADCSTTCYIVTRSGGRSGVVRCQSCAVKAFKLDEEQRTAEAMADYQRSDTSYGQTASASSAVSKFMIGAAAVGVVLMGLLFRTSYQRKPIAETQSTVTPAPQSTNVTSVSNGAPVQEVSPNQKRTGDMGTLFVDSGGPYVAVPKTEAYLDEMVRCSINKDREGFAKMVLDGKVWDVEQNTPVRVIGFGGWLSARYKIRITSGQSIMQEGWVPYEWVR